MGHIITNCIIMLPSHGGKIGIHVVLLLNECGEMLLYLQYIHAITLLLFYQEG